MMQTLLEVHNLKTYFYTRRGVVRAVDSVSFDVRKGEIYGLVGESGCGKSVTALSIIRLVPNPPGKIVEGIVKLKGENLLEKSNKEMRSIRGKEIAMIFQDPLTSLDPVMKVGSQMLEAIKSHYDVSDTEALRMIMESLHSVGISDPDVRVQQYPFQLSGGLRQRIMIATALLCKPSLLIADEPTTNLDVTVQAQILTLIKNLRDTIGTSVLLITHNLGIVAWLCDRLSVMYAGKIVEQADTRSIFTQPLHPYTQLLLRAIPGKGAFKTRLETIEGDVPNLINVPTGCRFHPRCPYAKSICAVEEPALLDFEANHKVSCHIYHHKRWGEI